MCAEVAPKWVKEVSRPILMSNHKVWGGDLYECAFGYSMSINSTIFFCMGLFFSFAVLSWSTSEFICWFHVCKTTRTSNNKHTIEEFL